MNSTNDYKKLTNLLIVAVVVIVGGVALGMSGVLGGNAAESSSLITFNETQHNFGDIVMQNGKVSRVFTMKNEGNAPAKLTDIRTSCMCTEAMIDGSVFGMHGPYVANITLAAGEEKDINVIFDPAAHGPGGVGPITRVVDIRTNSTETPMLSLKVTGNVTR